MKFTLSWLKKHLETSASLDEITRTLTMVGLEVEGVEDPAAKLAPFAVCEVLEAKQHPNADKLRVCRVKTATGEVQVVCGAPNARTGMKAIFAPVGSVIPATGDVLKAGSLRGEASNGMLVSEREMGLSDEHNGIIEVEDDTPIGTRLADLLGGNDPVIEIKLTPNRADCAGVRGIARDLAAAGLGALKPLDHTAVRGNYKSPLNVVIDDTKACPMFIGRYFRNVENGPSPLWLQNALKAIGLRPISVLVDITNYFTFDLGRPLHVFDADKVKGSTLRVGLSKGGEKLDGLNDKSYVLQPGMTVIADESGPEALGGILGGAPTGCSDDTRNVFLEVALFDPVRTAQTGRILGITSDARYRFERGLDPAMVEDYAEMASRMILELCGGEASELVIAGGEPQWERTYTLRPDRVKTLGGVDVSWDEQVNILETLGFDVDGQDVTPPSWRGDVEGEADLVEEVLRIKGYDCIPALPLDRTVPMTQSAITYRARKTAAARRAMAARGLLEGVTYSFVDEKAAALFGEVSPAMKLQNPIAADMNAMRPSILPGLLQAAARNAARGYPDVALFEIGPVFDVKANLHQADMLAMVRTGAAQPRNWHGTARNVDAFDAKADALAALDAMGVPTAGLQVSVDAPDYYHPGQSGCLRLGPLVVARFGVLHPAVLKALDVKMPAVAAEILIEALPLKEPKGTARPLVSLPAFQPLERDFAFVVANDVTAEKLVKAVKGAEKDLIANVVVFDQYTGKGMPEGRKSLALSVTLQPVEKTLTDADIVALEQKVVAAVAKAVGGELRQ